MKLVLRADDTTDITNAVSLGIGHVIHEFHLSGLFLAISYLFLLII